MPDSNSTLFQAQGLVHAGRPREATALLTRALQRGAGSASATAAICRLLSNLLLQAGDAQQALHYAQRAAASAPTDPDILVNHANILWNTGRPAEARALAVKAVAAHPASRNAHGTLVNFLIREDCFPEALAAAATALERFPNDAEFTGIRATMLLGAGRPEEAVAALRGALLREPSNLRLLGALAPALNYAPDIEPGEILRVHKAYGRALHAAMPAAPAPKWNRPADAERPLRIGLMSPDFRRHAMWHFNYPIIATLDREQFDIRCYFTAANADSGTESLRAAGGTWRHVPNLNIAQLADQIRADAVDILIDLAGHTRFHRLGTLALRAAPIQMNMVGYPCTTGIEETDYMVTDSWFTPPGSGGEEMFSERLLFVDPVHYCYQPPLADDLPDVTPRSRAPGEVLTFGSFSAQMKLNDKTVATWARVLKLVPGSRLIVKNIQLMQEDTRRLTHDRFVAAGIAPDRLEIVGHRGSMADHLATYARVDIALDTIPYAGNTTTCEAVLMGVPVVTLAQRTMMSRAGLMILSNAGLQDLVATSEDEFVALAVRLAADSPRLDALRASLRETFLASPLCDAPDFGRRFGSALREAWRDWCAKHAST